jgi:hypothetical protein
MNDSRQQSCKQKSRNNPWDILPDAMLTECTIYKKTRMIRDRFTKKLWVITSYRVNRKMRKQLVIIGIVTLFVSIGLSGCTDNNNDSSKLNEEKILGRWTETIPNTPITVIMNFFANRSFYEGINETTRIWGTYIMTAKIITLQYGEVIHIVEYSFSNNDNTLTLNETSNGGVYLVLTKQ